jgi:hypothetical protein
VQGFDHVEGERAALVGLLVEEAEAAIRPCAAQIVGKGLYRRPRLRFGLLGKAREADLVEVDVVDELLALAAGVFDLVAQLRAGRTGRRRRPRAWRGRLRSPRAAACLRCG